MLVEGRHFLSTVEPARLGHKALAVNLSDLAPAARSRWPSRSRWRCPASTNLARRLLARPVRAGRRARLRAGRRRHHARAAQHLHHGVRRSAGRRGAAALGRARRRRPLGERHAGRCAAGAGGVSRHAGAAAEPSKRARMRMEQPTAARRAGAGAARHRDRGGRRERRAARRPGPHPAASGVGATLDADAARCAARREAPGLATGNFAHLRAVGRRRLRAGLHRAGHRRAVRSSRPASQRRRASRASAASRPKPACASSMRAVRRCHSASARSTTSSDSSGFRSGAANHRLHLALRRVDRGRLAVQLLQHLVELGLHGRVGHGDRGAR
jgi:hypothetical protein